MDEGAWRAQGVQAPIFTNKYDKFEIIENKSKPIGASDGHP
nr:hypothetical protein [uncultured Rhodoferax sp.]